MPAAGVNIASEVGGALLVSVLAISVLVMADLLRRWTQLPCETTRKFAHAGSGGTLLVVPLLVSSHWTVLGLALSFALIMFVTKMSGVLDGVHGVGRGISGVLWYPLTGWLLYYLVYEWLDGDYVMYAMPVMVLAAADAFGALVGTAYGRHGYEVIEGQHRSLEGSAAFALVAYACLHLPLLLSGLVPVEQGLLIAFSIAILATMMESISAHGLDNIVVPFGVLFFMHEMLPLSTAELQLRLVLLAACAVGGLIISWRKPNTAGGLVGLVLAAYTVGAIGGAEWLGPFTGLMLAFAIYERMTPSQDAYTKSRYELATAVSTLLAPVVLVLVYTVTSNSSARHALYVAYLATLACNAAVLFYMLPQHRTFRLKRLRRSVSARDPWMYRVTLGKLLFALAGASLPLLLRPDALATMSSTGLALVVGLGGLFTFVVVAAIPRSRRACPACGSISIRGLYCCQDLRLGDGEPRTWLTPTFRRTYLLANTIVAVATAGLLWAR